MKNIEKRAVFIRIIILVLFYAVLTVRRDGFFPFSRDVSEEILAWFQVLQSIMFLSLLLLFVFAEKIRFSSRIVDFIERNSYRLTIIVIPILVSTIFILFNHEINKFSEYYAVNKIVFAGLVITSFIIIIIPLILKKPKESFGALFLGSLLLFFLPVLYFKITANISDLLPIVSEQLKALINGENMYQYFVLDNEVTTQAVRQPGTTLIYLPAYILKLDLRIISVIFTLLTGFVFLKFSYTSIRDVKFDLKFLLTYFILLLFLLFPYRHLRHDLYEPFYWCLLSLSLLFLSRSKLLFFSTAWGISIFTQVWSWIFSPFVSLFIWRKHGFKKALIYSTIFLFVGVGLLSVFILREPSAYSEHVLGYYNNLLDSGIYAATTIHITPIFHIYNIETLLRPLQILVVASLGIISVLTIKNFKSLLSMLMLVIFSFIQLNIISWNYMYISMLVLMSILILYSFGRKSATL